MILRDYQLAMVDQARHAMHSVRAVILQLATGGGKTPTACAIIKNSVDKQKHTLFMAHRGELLTQASQKLTLFGIEHGTIKAGKLGNLGHSVQVASVQTLVRRLEKTQFAFTPDLIVIDECHLAEANSYKTILSRFPAAYIIGLSATPGRLDGRGLGKPKGNFDRIICGPSMADLIAMNFLVPLRYFSAPNLPDLGDIKTQGGDYAQKPLAQAVDKPKITGDVVAHWKELALNRKTIVFCVSIEHADHVATGFREAGIKAISVNGTWAEDVRARALHDFEHGTVNVLVNCQLYVEGLDIPVVNCIADLAPTQSLTRFLQRAGRGMRPFPGKDHCIYLDHAGNVNRFGLPTDPREWSLEGAESKKKSAERALSIRVCPHCFSAQATGKSRCGNCGRLFPIEPRKIAHEDGRLQEITPQMLAKRYLRREVGRADSLVGLIAIGRQRGYRDPEAWARYVMEGRQRKRQSR
jgi:DNA repair protein RadD